MTLAFKQVKVYLRASIVLMVVGAIGLVLFMNRSNEVAFWFFGLTHEDKPTNVVWLMLGTGSGAIATWRIFSFARGLWRDMNEVVRLKAIEEADQKHKQRTVELEERERSIEEKLKRAAANDGESGKSE